MSDWKLIEDAPAERPVIVGGWMRPQFSKENDLFWAEEPMIVFVLVRGFKVKTRRLHQFDTATHWREMPPPPADHG
jgi:hypothetical protein